MNKKIFELEKKGILIVTSQYIAITMKNTKEFDELLKWSEMVSMKNDFTKIYRKNLIKAKFNVLAKSIEIKYSSPDDLNDSIYMILKKEEEVMELGNLVAEVMNLKKIEKNESKLKPIIQSLLEFCGVLLIFGVLIQLINLKNNGEEISFGSGRRSGSTRIVFSIVDAIGIPATSVIGVIIISFIVYRAYLRFKKPSKEIILKK